MIPARLFPTSSDLPSRSISPFSLRDWIFSLKTFAAAALALYIGLAMDLPRPYWAMATVYICSQPLSGATRSKAAYRICGTLLGAIASLALVPNSAHAPEILSFAIAALVAFCLFVSLLDRTPRGYIFILAGYTTALIGFPIVSHPETVFDTALSRLEEITLGIVCAAAVSGVVFPSDVGSVVAARLGTWLRDADRWSTDILERRDQGRASHSHRLRLASDAASLDTIATWLAFDTSNRRYAARNLRMLRLRMLMALPVLTSLSEIMRELVAEGTPFSREIRALLDEILLALRDGIDVPLETMERLSRLVADMDRALDPAEGPRHLRMMCFLVRLKDSMDLRQDCRHLHRDVAAGRPTKHTLLYRSEAGLPNARHRDVGMAALSALAAFVSVGGLCWFWIVTSWPEGGTAAMIAAVVCCLFASQDDPVATLRSFASWSAVAALVTIVYLFAVLPRVQDFEVLVMVLAPAYILFGLLATKRATANASIALSLWSATLMALQETYTADFAAVVNSALALLAGIWFVVFVFRLVRSTGTEWTLHRLVEANRLTLAEAAEHTGKRDRAKFAALMLDRLGLLAPILASAMPDTARRVLDPLDDVRIGLEIVELRHARHGLPQPALQAIDSMLVALARHFRDAPTRPDATLLQLIDKAITAVTAAPTGKQRREALLGLVDLRGMLNRSQRPAAG